MNSCYGLAALVEFEVQKVLMEVGHFGLGQENRYV